MKIIEKVFGTHSQRELKRIEDIVAKVESLDESMQQLKDRELRAKTTEFKERIAKGESLDDILPEAYAVCREMSHRVLGMKHFRVQIIGGIILHYGRIAEMRTGEGKTLVGTLPVYLNALSGKGVHVVTVNDYLAQRDSDEMGELYKALGLTVGCISSNMSQHERRNAYLCDITYGTNNEYGFDYLRDNMVMNEHEKVQRGLNFAVIDEVDSVLIDEARTPLIISGQGSKSTTLYTQADMFVRRLRKGRLLGEESTMSNLMREEIEEEGDFIVDEKRKTVTLTQEGVEKAEKYFKLDNLSDPENTEIQHHINIALKAHNTMHREKDYIVNEKGEIVIVDEFTGRLMDGRRYSDGLHQAIEAKEGVEIKKESNTLATITFQSYFNKYTKKSGMTGTGQTEEREFRDIYGMDVIVIPTNKPIQRIDHTDVLYKTQEAKFNAVVADVKESYERRQPVLVGTSNIDTSEMLSELLKKAGIPHNVLNAKYHEQEAEIVSKAGYKGAVTIATNMAGRGTDIKLEEGVQDLGGLKIIGTERHESRRIDNQLRGRAGRQGDKGESKFYLSLEDDLLRLFMPEGMLNMLNSLGMPDDQPVQNKSITSSIEKAQLRVEGNNFGVRKHLLEYDKTMNEQREILYGEREKVLLNENPKETLLIMAEKILDRYIEDLMAVSKQPESWNLEELRNSIRTIVPIPFKIIEMDKKNISADQIRELFKGEIRAFYEHKETEIGTMFREIARVTLLKIIDQKWMDHLDAMEQLKQGINLQAYGQRDPLVEYKFASYDMFEEMSNTIQEEATRCIFGIKVLSHAPMEQELDLKVVSEDDEEEITA